MYRSSLKQQVQESQPISSLDLNYSRYLDFANTEIFDQYNQTYTITQKGMLFGNNEIWYNDNAIRLLINNIDFASTNKSRDVNHRGLDALPVSAGTEIRVDRSNGSYGSYILSFVPFIDQTIIVPDFSQMTDLSDMLSYTVTEDGILLGKTTYGTFPYEINITYNNKSITAGKFSRHIQYVIRGMTIAGDGNSKLVNWYYIPMEE